MTETAELARAVLGLVELVQQYGPTIGAVVTTLLAKKAVTHARQASTDAKAARDSSSKAATESHGAKEAADKTRQMTDTGIMRVFNYLDKRIGTLEANKERGKHAGSTGMDRGTP